MNAAPDSDIGFATRRAAVLAELAADAGDLSRAGHVDARARRCVGVVNLHPHFYTTSSCAGRVSLFADPTAATRAGGMKGGEWVYVNHEPADADDVVAAVAHKLEGEGARGGDPECTLVLRFEPFILAVEAVSVEEGSRMVAAAREAGFRESGITSCDKRIIIAVRCSIRMEVPVVSKGVRLVTEEGLRGLIAIANEKHAANAARADRLVERFTAVFGAELEPAAEARAGVAGATEAVEAAKVAGAGGVNLRLSRVEAAQRRVLAALDAVEAAVSGGRGGGDVRAAAAEARAARLAAAGAAAEAVEGTAGERGGWILFVDKAAAKRCKDAIKSCAWLDRSRRAGASRDGTRIALPITSIGATALLRTFSIDGAGAPAADNAAAAQPALLALAEGAAELVQSTADGGGSDSGGGGGDGGDRNSGYGNSGSYEVGSIQLQPKAMHKSPAAVIKAAALSLLPSTSPAPAPGELPSKWEKLGDLALLPAGCFASDAVWTPAVCRQLYPLVAAALGVTRLARQAEVGAGPKRESRAIMLWDVEVGLAVRSCMFRVSSLKLKI
jgi:tRNA wybutosine-synthesizing protein 3